MLLAALCSVRLYKNGERPPALPQDSVLLRVPADGLCFWSSLFLARAATPDQLQGWYMRPRTSSGFGSPEEIQLERQMVVDYLSELRLKDMPEATWNRIAKWKSAVHSDIEPWCVS